MLATLQVASEAQPRLFVEELAAVRAARARAPDLGGVVEEQLKARRFLRAQARTCTLSLRYAAAPAAATRGVAARRILRAICVARRARRRPAPPAARRTSASVDRAGPARPRRVDERQAGHRRPLLAEIDLRQPERLRDRPRTRDRRSAAPRRARRHRREVGPVRHELGLDAEADARTEHLISATEVRELVSSAMRRISLDRPSVKSATDATGPREPMPTPGTKR